MMPEPVAGPNREGYAVDLGLWTGVLGPPIIWLAHFQIIYTLVGYVCMKHSHVTMHLTSGITLAITIGCALLSWSLLKPPPSEEPGNQPIETVPARPRFMALIGIMSGTMFSLVVIAQWIAAFMIDPCWR